jgi:hypothetical protein
VEQRLLGGLGKVDQDVEADNRIEGGRRKIDSCRVGVQEGRRRHESAGPVDLDFTEVDPSHRVAVRRERSCHGDAAAASQIQHASPMMQPISQTVDPLGVVRWNVFVAPITVRDSVVSAADKVVRVALAHDRILVRTTSHRNQVVGACQRRTALVLCRPDARTSA